MRVVVVSMVDPLAAPYVADVDSVLAALAARTSDGAVLPEPVAATKAASQLEALARLSPQIRAVVQVHHTHGFDILTPIR